MKKQILTLGLFILISSAFAHGTSVLAVNGVYQSGDDMNAKVAKATEKLKLTKDQQVKFKNYLVQKDAEKKELQGKTYATPEEKNAARKKFSDKYNAELKKILTAEQMKIMES